MLNRHSELEMTKTGVYKIQNLQNNKFYIGSTIWRFKYRLNKHTKLLDTNKHPNELLQHDWNNYSSDNFEFIILDFSSKSESITRELEQYYLDKENAVSVGYNISSSAYYGSTGYPEYVIDKMRQASLKPENTELRVTAYKKWYKDNSRKVDVYTLDGEFFRAFDSVVALSEYSQNPDNDLPIIVTTKTRNKKLRREHILRVLCGQRDQMKGLYFNYAD